MRPLKILPILLTIVSCSAAPLALVHSIRDDSQGVTIFRLEGNELSRSSLIANPWSQLFLNLECIHSDSGQSDLYLIAEYHGITWMRIEEGQTLTIKADDEEMYFSGEGSSNHRVAIHIDEGRIEQAWYPITLEQLERLLLQRMFMSRSKGAYSP